MSENETTTEMLAETEAQATEYTPPEGWRVLAVGEKLQAGDMWVWPNSDEQRPTILVGAFVGSNQRYIRRIEPQSKPQPQPEPQPVQVRKGRWRTRGGQVYYVTPSPEDDPRRGQFPWRNASDGLTWREDGRWVDHEESMFDLIKYLGPIEQPEKTITPDDVAGEALAGVWDSAKAEQQIEELQAQVDFLKDRELKLGTRLQEEKAVTTKRLDQIQELRSEVSHVQRLLGESRQRVTQLEELVGSLRTINEATEKAVISAGRENTDLQHRLDVVASEWALQAGTISGLQQQVEAVKAELVQERLERNQWQNQAQRTETQLIEKISKCRQLQIELDALHQAPQAETAATVPTSTEDRFEEGWDAGTARAVETIAEWTEPFRRCGSERLAWMVMQNLPHIMRTLTGLTPED